MKEAIVNLIDRKADLQAEIQIRDLPKTNLECNALDRDCLEKNKRSYI
jgi:hypothetical protein